MMDHSESGQHGHCDSGHCYGCLGAGGKDRLFPLVAVLLLSRKTLPVRVVLANEYFQLFSKFAVYIGQGEGSIFLLGPFGLFSNLI